MDRANAALGKSDRPNAAFAQERAASRARVAARRSFPDGVFGRLPGRSTTTSAGRTPTADTTRGRHVLARSPAPPPARVARRDSTATRNDSRCRAPSASSRTATALPARTPVGARGGPLDVGRVDVAAAHDDHVLDAGRRRPPRRRPGSPRRRCPASRRRPASRPGRRRSGSPASPTRRAAAAPRPPARRARHRRRRRPGPRCPAAAARAAGTAAPDRRRPGRRGGAPPARRRRSRRPAARCRPVRTRPPAPSRPSRRRRRPTSGRSPNRAPAVGERGDGGGIDRLRAVEREPQRRQVQRSLVGAGRAGGRGRRRRSSVRPSRCRGRREISSAHSSGRPRKSVGVTLTSSIPTAIGRVRKPTMPMSWKSGSHDTITSPPVSSRAACTIAPMLACRLRWVMRTALGSAVEPLVSCSSAVSSSPATSASGVTGSPSRSASRRHGMPCWASTAAERLEGRPEQHDLRADHREHPDGLLRPDREVGPRRWAGAASSRCRRASQTACAAGAIAAGSPASTPTARAPADPGRRQCTRGPAGGLVDLGPGPADGGARFPGGHAVG